jgi:hypothetical protein
VIDTIILILLNVTCFVGRISIMKVLYATFMNYFLGVCENYHLK